MNTKLHAVTDAHGRPIRLHITAGQISDYIGAAVLIEKLPKVDWLLADRGYDADWFRKRLKDKEIKPCIRGAKTVRRLSSMTNADTSDVIVLKSCLTD
jgi:transposase